MIKIEAVVRNTKLHAVQDALLDIGISTFSAYEIKLAGIHKGHTSTGGRPGTFKASNLVAKTNIVIMCPDKDEEKVITTIATAAKTGQKGDGLISVYPITKLHKIRNGATGEAAIL